jgi:GDSL-like Lipase/Acylhydrolase family
MQNIALENGPIGVVGALDVDRRDSGIVLRRLPDWTRPQVPAFMEIMLTMPSGVRLEFVTDARNIELDVLPTRIEISKPPLPTAFDLVMDGDSVRTERTDCGDRLQIDMANRGKATRVRGEPGCIRFADLPPGEKHCELWLPANAILELRGLRIDDGATISAAPRHTRPRWVHHGSSISHCTEAHSPTRTWPAVAARLADVELLNLGLAGNCHLDQFVARTMRDEAADVLSLKVGINVVNLDSLKERTFAPALHGFIDTIREGKPTTPLLIASPIFCPPAELHPGPTIPNADGVFVTLPGHEAVQAGSLTLTQMRDIIAGIVEGRRRRGDANLHYLDGLTLFGAADVNDLPDHLHPNGDGYVRMGQRFHAAAFGAGGPLQVPRNASR